MFGPVTELLHWDPGEDSCLVVSQYISAKIRGCQIEFNVEREAFHTKVLVTLYYGSYFVSILR